jgi:4-amino-4-deoxy-L-arabinose transferase-like glycosyltransferase
MVVSETVVSKTRVSVVVRWISTGGVIAITLFLLLYQLDGFPMPWYDEGSHLHVAKNYALQGVYADSSSEGYRPFGPAIGVGPTVIMPIAALFKLGGVSIVNARLLIVVYSLLTLVVVYMITLRMTSWPYALLAVMLLLLTSSIRYQYYSRTVVGEAPGMFFLMLGLALWLHPRGRSILGLVGVGILIGLSTITKNQYAFFILPSLFVCWIADIVWYKQRGWRYFVIPGVISGLMFGLWLFIVIIKLGQGNNFAENLATLQTAGMGAFIVIDSQSIQRVMTFLTDTNLYGTLFIPALLYGALISLRRDEKSQQRGIVALFLIVSTVLFTISLGWDRYAFGPVVLSVFFVVLLIQDLVHLVNFNDLSPLKLIRTGKTSVSAAIGTLLVGWFIVALLIPLYSRVHDISALTNRDAYRVADWLETNVPKTTLIETWEQEQGVLTDHNFHYPPQRILAYSVAETWQKGAPVGQFYNFHDYVEPEYVVVGPFSVYTKLYSADQLKDYEIVKQFGPYTVYHKRS